MNRGRHKKPNFPYGEYVDIKLTYFNNSLTLPRISYVYDYRKFANESLLNHQILKWMTDKYFNILKIQIRYNQKTIRVYKKNQFHNYRYDKPW